MNLKHTPKMLSKLCKVAVLFIFYFFAHCGSLAVCRNGQSEFPIWSTLPKDVIKVWQQWFAVNNWRAPDSGCQSGRECASLLYLVRFRTVRAVLWGPMQSCATGLHELWVCVRLTSVLTLGKTVMWIPLSQCGLVCVSRCMCVSVCH